MLISFLIKLDCVYEHFIPTVPWKKTKSKALVIKAWLRGGKPEAVEAHSSQKAPQQKKSLPHSPFGDLESITVILLFPFLFSRNSRILMNNRSFAALAFSEAIIFTWARILRIT